MARKQSLSSKRATKPRRPRAARKVVRVAELPPVAPTPEAQFANAAAPRLTVEQENELLRQELKRTTHLLDQVTKAHSRMKDTLLINLDAPRPSVQTPWGPVEATSDGLQFLLQKIYENPRHTTAA